MVGSLAALLQQKEVELVQILARETDISVYEAERFVPEASTAVNEAIASHAGNLDIEDLTGVSNVRSLLGIIDIACLGARTGVSPQKAASGLVALSPVILGFLGAYAGGRTLLLDDLIEEDAVRDSHRAAVL